jgi:transposase
VVSKKRREFRVSQKVEWVKRLSAGEEVAALAQELGIRSQLLYKWQAQYRCGGTSGLSTSGHPIRPRPWKDDIPPATALDDLSQAKRRIADLERKVGQQQVDLDFFRQALRHVRGERRPSDGSGVTKSTKSSRR